MDHDDVDDVAHDGFGDAYDVKIHLILKIISKKRQVKNFILIINELKLSLYKWKNIVWVAGV